MTLHVKMAISDLQDILETLIWSKCGRYRRFFGSTSFFLKYFLLCKECPSHFLRETKNENEQFKETKTFQSWSDKALKDTVVNRKVSSLHGRSLAYSPFKKWTIMLGHIFTSLYSSFRRNGQKKRPIRTSSYARLPLWIRKTEREPVLAAAKKEP